MRFLPPEIEHRVSIPVSIAQEVVHAVDAARKASFALFGHHKAIT